MMRNGQVTLPREADDDGGAEESDADFAADVDDHGAEAASTYTSSAQAGVIMQHHSRAHGNNQSPVHAKLKATATSDPSFQLNSP